MPNPTFAKSDSRPQNNHNGIGGQINNENGDQYNATTINFGHMNKDEERRRHILRTLPSNIDELNLDRFFQMLSVVNQYEHDATAPPLSLDESRFYWVIKETNFAKWNQEESPQVLWLSGPSERYNEFVSSYIVQQHRKPDHLLLYFFCRAATWNLHIERDFVHTLLNQMLRRSNREKIISIMRHFLYTLFEALKKAPTSSWKTWNFNEIGSADESIQRLLDAPTTYLFDALRSVLGGEEKHGLLVVDGIDKVIRKGDEFAESVRVLVDHLQQRLPKVKILLTGRPLGKLTEIFSGLSSIEYDRERKDCLHSLRFEDQRSAKISREYKHTCEWLWEHPQYKKWSTSQLSHLLLIQGKPGSGKSTITKYFYNNLLQREPTASRAIVAKFFYSYREGELHRSHYHMFRSILYDILDQDELFFYHKVQSKYRELRSRRVGWDRASLTEVLESLYDYASAKQLYLIIDAVDESEDEDRLEVLSLLFRLCNERKHTMTRVFIASRPVEGLWLGRQRQYQTVITLQNETRPDIERFAQSFLRELDLTRVLDDALKYIIEHAQGVFLWVKLVGRALTKYSHNGCSEDDICKYLMSLPTELEAYYTHMLEEMTTDESHLGDGVKMLLFVLFSSRPLTVGELLHAVATPDDPRPQFVPSNDAFQKRIPSRERVHSCGGNFLEIESDHGLETVQVMHQTVREFFLRPNGWVANSKFRMCVSEANISISITCIRYLRLCVASTTLAQKPADGNNRSRTRQQISSFANSIIPKRSPDIKYWTPERIEDFAKCLDERPLAHYALQHLRGHRESCQGDANIQNITGQFVTELKQSPAAYLLESWIRSNLNYRLLSKSKGVAANEFRTQMLNAASRSGLPNAVGILLAAAADAKVKDTDGWTILRRAVNQGQEAVVRAILLSGKVDINETDESGSTALHRAVERANKTMVKLLVDGKADLNSTDDNQDTSLHLAIKAGNEAALRLLIDGKADLDIVNKNGNQALHEAVLRRDGAMVRLLVTGQADVNLNNDDGSTALHWAVEQGSMAIATILVEEANARVNSKDGIGNTALIMAVERHDEAMARYLVVRGKADVNVQDRSNRTALHLAAENGLEAIGRLLVVEGEADVDAKDCIGRTPLHWAARLGYEAIVRLLLVEGRADAYAQENSGKTALQLAMNRGHEAVERLLAELQDSRGSPFALPYFNE